jgi:Trk-type K+ transport system membrane component
LTGSVGTGLGVVIGLGLGLGVAVTTSVAVLEYELARGADALAESCHCWPIVALAGTATVASSSSAWPSVRLPTVHVVPFGAGQTMNFGAPNLGPLSTFVETVTSWLGATVVHTQITKLATLPGAT